MNRILLITFLLYTSFASAQKKVLDHSVYDAWKSLENLSVTDDGKFAIAIIKEQEGDGRLLIRQLSSKRELMIPRGYTYTISPDQKHIIALIKAPFTTTRKARIKKTAEEKMPKDSLAIISLDHLSITKMANVNSFKTGKDFSQYIAYTLSDTLKIKDKEKAKSETLIIQRLGTEEKDTIRFVSEYIFSRNGQALAIATNPAKKDSTDARIWYVNLKQYDKKIVSEKRTQYKSLALSESGNKLAFLATSDSSKKEIKDFQLYAYIAGADSAGVLANKNKQGMPGKWAVSEYRIPVYSKNEERLFFGIAPVVAPKDTTIPDFEKAVLDIWHWQEPLIQPQQLVELKQKKEQSYLSFIELNKPDQLYQLATEEMPDVQVSDEHNGRFALGTSSLKYRFEVQWNFHIRSTYDVWILDLLAHTSKQIKTRLQAECHFSPKGNYLAWYDIEDQKYYAYSINTAKEICLTEKTGVNFWNEKNDVPAAPNSYGAATWTEDECLWVYDAYDIWKLDPSGIKVPENITKGVGRSRKTTLRYFRTDPESRFVKTKEKPILSAFDHTSKERGFYEMDKSGAKLLVMDKFNYTTPVKAKKQDVYLYTKSNFETSPDLYVTSNKWKSELCLSDINPQMKAYNWGTAELISWITFDGKPTEGIVYKPENFDPTKKYPLMVYYYEKHADHLYHYHPPIPSRSIINISFYCSRGYIVFTPDIQYTFGHPGESAYNSVISGVDELCKNAWIDQANMALQGQSWGGYQTGYLITRTNIFKAAGAGAPVSNMFSAYGGIRWATGRSRQYQYEQTQSRIGKTIWEAPELYRENSPIFFADKVETPLLIMHNDKDGAVPWYQGIEYFMALRRLGKPVWLLQYNNEAHNLTERRNQKDLGIRMQQFFDHYLKGDPMPVWMKTGIPAIEKGENYGYDTEN